MMGHLCPDSGQGGWESEISAWCPQRDVWLRVEDDCNGFVI